MKSIVLIVLTILMADSAIGADVICINKKEYEIPEIARRAQISASFRIHYDIVNYEPQAIRIEPDDSISASFLELFATANHKNISNITYLKDSLNYELVLKYIVRSASALNRDYAEVDSDKVLRLVFARPGTFTYDERIVGFAPDADSVYFDNFITYSGGNHYVSNIFVERVFNAQSDTTHILSNNYPELKEVILIESAKYSKADFMSLIVGRKPHKGQRYFIRFYLRRFLQDCGYDKIY